MNLIEITELINAIPKDDADMIEFYINKRLGLVAEINKDIVSLGQNPMDLKQLLLLSAKPELAETV